MKLKTRYFYLEKGTTLSSNKLSFANRIESSQEIGAEQDALTGKPPRPKKKIVQESNRKTTPSTSPRQSPKPSPRQSPIAFTSDDRPSQSALALGLAILERTRSGNSLTNLSNKAIKSLVEETVQEMVEVEDINSDTDEDDPSEVPALIHHTSIYHVSDVTLLDAVIKNSSIEEINDLITRCNVNIDARDRQGMSALHHACKMGSTRLAELLIKHGADCDIIGNNGWNALHLAASGGCDELVSLISSHTKVSSIFQIMT